MTCRLRRRDFLLGSGASLIASTLAPGLARADDPPKLPVSINACGTYDPFILLAHLKTMAAQVGGLFRLVSGKTVAVKLNLTGDTRIGMLGLPAGRTYQVHPNLALAVAALLDSNGAKRIRFVEGTYQSALPLAGYLQQAGWDLAPYSGLRAKVEFEDTRNLGNGTTYSRINVPGGGSLFPAYEVNHSYVDCDVFLSLAKMKNHVVGGVTLGMKNSLGITPTSLYSQSTQDESATANRSAIIHVRDELPPAGVPQEVNPQSPVFSSVRVPECIVDLVAARPIDLTVIDGIESVAGGEGWWCSPTWRVTPGVLLMGRNPVNTDAVAMAVMGYDPMAPPQTGPFPGDNHLAMAAALGLGSNDVSRIPIVGLPLAKALYPYNWEPPVRGT